MITKWILRIIAASMLVILLVIFDLPDARGDTLYLGQVTYHPNKSDSIKREDHSLIIYERKRYMVGYWRNSYDKHTLAVGRRLVHARGQYGTFGTKLGVATGYRTPFYGSFYYQYGLIDVNFIPGEVYGLGLRWDF